MNRRSFIKTAGMSLAALSTGCQSSHKRRRRRRYENDTRPNIVFILADDMGWSDLGCYGGEISTPNLDKIAKNGIRFTQMHNTSKCFPSRACLLTGVYAQQCGMGKGFDKIENALTLGEVLRSARYNTLAVGKHHAKENLYNRGFNSYYGLRDGACNFFNPGKQRPGEGLPGQKKREKRVWCFDEKTVVPYTPEEKDFYTTDYFTKWAIGFLDKYKEERAPFFLYLAYNAPHDPLQAWPEDIAKYKGKYIAGYEAIRNARYKRQQEMGLIDKTFPLSKPTHREWDSLSEEQKKDQDLRMAVYAGMIECMDRNIGKLLQKIKDMGKEENTLIIFASDNGCSAETVQKGTGEIGSMTRWSSLGPDWANVSNTPFRLYKNNSYEGGICTPFIAYWPKEIKKGSFSDFRGHFIDVMATFVDISGAQYPEEYNGQEITPLQGESFLPILKGKDIQRKKPIFYQWKTGKAVTKDNWKLVSDKDKWELFDIDKDQTETNNLINKHPEKAEELKALWEEWYKSCNVK